MREWKSKINGKELRDLISEEKSYEILKQLEFLLWRITKNPSAYKLDEFDVEEFEDLLVNVESDVAGGEDSLIEYVNGEDWIEDTQELVNDRLAQFYDLCDSNNIWVTV